MDAKKLTEGQRSYEAKRAAKAGMSLEAWMRDKEKRAKEDAAAAAKVAEAEAPVKKPGFFTRLMDRAHKPI
jgi:3-hydroxyisobutyrate dehydrogenase-like beta-hydroxyacid dehydrogenase